MQEVCRKTTVNLVLVRSIAKRARAWAVRANAQLRQNSKRGMKLNGFSSDLTGMCAIASAYLLTKLNQAGLPAVAYEGADHFFVMCGGYVVDITATQFGFEPVYIESRRAIRGMAQYNRRPNSACYSAEDIRQRQIKYDWPSEQTVWPELAKGDSRIYKHIVAYC